LAAKETTVSLRCYNHSPEPSFFGAAEATGYWPEPFPTYQPDLAPPLEKELLPGTEPLPEPEPPLEAELPPRYYPEYLANVYLAQSSDDLWERMNQTPTGPPTLVVLPSRYKPCQPIEKSKFTVCPPRLVDPDDEYLVRPIAARVAQEVSDLCILVSQYPHIEIEDLTDQMAAAFRMLRRMAKQRRKGLSLRPDGEWKRPGGGQLTLV